ncbi:MAG: hypothetical protein K6G79_04340 [Bacteroidales bacterium]|nr:hypothetical protein [Bacteroidales bacterium]
MENNDNTLREMQEQMQQLREKLDSQKIVNERILKKSCSQTASRLRFKANLPILFGVAAILLAPSLHSLGVSMWFIIFTWAVMLVCIVATLLTNRHIPQMDRDLVTATRELTRFKKIHAEWIKFAIPMIIVWVGLLCWDLFRNGNIDDPMLQYSFLAGIATGIVLGGIIGFKTRRDQLNAADELLDQIEELHRDD